MGLLGNDKLFRKRPTKSAPIRSLSLKIQARTTQMKKDIFKIFSIRYNSI